MAHQIANIVTSQQAAFGGNVTVICMHTCLPVQSVCELVDWRWDLQPLQENGLLSLQTDVLGPSHEPAQVPLGLDVLAYTKDTVETSIV